ncbi:MAG: hypothetical protein ACHQEM_04385 [Chitinophagales bacterium]
MPAFHWGAIGEMPEKPMIKLWVNNKKSQKESITGKDGPGKK